ncbi:hypothetical protein SBV1_370006 [Verrucomicrobia bacterium]|nr:hypothetical protein SBV1_370006 [Verrucomicrobiota bacterium]
MLGVAAAAGGHHVGYAAVEAAYESVVVV